MTVSPQAVRASYDVQTDVINAANAVLGVLELIAEAPCSESTERDVHRALSATEACLAELDLSRAELIDGASANGTGPPEPPPWMPPECNDAQSRGYGVVLPLRTRRSRQCG
jgi:hypothetical protein